MSVRSIFSVTVRLLGAYKGQKRAKIGQRGVKNTKSHMTKPDFKVPKIHSWVVKLICYLKVSVRSIFSIAVRLLGASKGQKRAKIGPKGVKNTKSHITKPNWISKCPKFIAG